MTVQAGTPRPAAALSTIPLRRRLYGFGSIYGKTIRDSRLAFIIAAGLFGGLSLVMGAAIGTVFPNPEARVEIDKLIGSMPASMVNLFGNATLMGPKLGTLGGYMTWKYGALFALGTGLWSILALSGTLAGEAARGSLDMVAAAPFGKRRIALEKLAAHLTMLWLAMAIVAVTIVVSSNAYGTAALGDPVPLAGSWRSPLPRCSAAPARPPSRGSPWSPCGRQAAWTSAVRWSMSARSTGRSTTSRSSASTTGPASLPWGSAPSCSLPSASSCSAAATSG